LTAVVRSAREHYNSARFWIVGRSGVSMIALSWPNWVTAVRILLIGPFVICLLNLQVWSAARWAALTMFGLMAASDVLDGFLARHLRSHTPLGKFLDPLADKLLVICTVIALAAPGSSVPGKVLPNWVVVAAVGKDLVVVLGFVLIYLTTGRTFVCPRVVGKACTGVQFAMVVAVLLWPNLPSPLRRVPDVLWWAATVLAVMAAIDYIRLGMQFVSSVGNNANRQG
jgi:CDP-diacylglycerol--glycerol-3-phosphate 3-phosphatidyltransferase